MTPEAFVEYLGREKASAILRTNDQDDRVSDFHEFDRFHAIAHDLSR